MLTQRNYFDDLQVAFVGHFRSLHNGTFRQRDMLRIGLMTGQEVVKITRAGENIVQCPILFFNFAHEEYVWKSSSRTARESYFFDISGPRADRIQETLRNDFPQGFIRCNDPAPFLLILDAMKESFYNYRVQRPYRLPMFAEQFLTQIYVDHTSALSASKYEAGIRNTAQKICESPGNSFDFFLCAKSLGITDTHYRRLFKSVIGLPPAQYQQKCRLTYAMGLLKKSKELQIQQIAEMCGFNSSSEFSRFFKKHTGFSPIYYCQKFGE